MSEVVKPFLMRFLDYPLPVIFAGFYMYWMAEVLKWAMTLENPAEAQILVVAVVTGGAAYFRFYIDLIIKSKNI